MSPKTHFFKLERTDRQATVQRSDLICVELPENPTSGYRWQLAPHIKLSGLKLIEQTVADSKDHTLQTRTFVFSPTGESSESALQFALNRSASSKNPALHHFDVSVKVKD